MAVQDHPKYDEWSQALDDLKEANDRLREARVTNSAALEAAKLDFFKAKERYDQICDEIG